MKEYKMENFGIWVKTDLAIYRIVYEDTKKINERNIK
tara:strand:+ start:207 stop:317 length:111 start_codon:yes stop_codon:yes gene_type:complete